MANRSVSVFGDFETNSIFVFNGGTSSNRLTMEEGDVLTVTHTLASSIFLNNIVVDGFSTNQWTSGTSMSLSRGSSATRTIKTNPTEANISLSVNSTGYTGGTIFIQVLSSIDTTPDQFDIGANITNANPNQEYFIGSFTVSGINTGTTMSCSGTANTTTRIGTSGTKSSSNKTVFNGNVVYVFGDSSSNYNASTTATVTIGGVSDSATISTKVDPATGEVIPFPIGSGTISMDNIRSFFGPVSGTASLSNYYRGGSYIPNITSGTPNNSNIPTSGTISLSNFYNSMTTLYFSEIASNKSNFQQTNSSGGEAGVSWNKQNDWEVGFGPDMEDIVEYRITVNPSNYTVSPLTGSYLEIIINGVVTDRTNSTTQLQTGFAKLNDDITIFLGSDRLAEGFAAGSITVEIRHPDYTSVVFSDTFTYNLGLIGP